MNLPPINGTNGQYHPRIPLVDLKAQYANLKSEIDESIQKILDSAYFLEGPFVEAFEKKFATYCDVPHAIALDSGTAAIELGLRALGFQPGDEIIIPAHTFIATAAPAAAIGLRCVFVDVDDKTWQMEPERIRAAITPRTRAVMAVHLYGMPVPIDEIRTLCENHDILFLEDAAQAHGARYKGVPVGGFGSFAAFSCYPAKNLGAYGDAGILTTRDPDLAGRVASLRNHGRLTKYEHSEIGHNYRMDAIQGAVLGIKLKHLDDWNAIRRMWAKRYSERLAKLPIQLPCLISDTEPVWHLFTLHTPYRDALAKYLANLGVDTGIHYPIPLHLQPAFADLGGKPGDHPVSEKIGRETLSLPLYPELTMEQWDKVCSYIENFFSQSVSILEKNKNVSTT